ncbi:MAG: N-acetyl-alpha-D-glucosaminyl L-malate synthase BshA [Planctomycetota bacterium]
MRLAVLCYPTYGGSGVVASELAIGLADRGHEVHVIAHDRPFRIDRWLPNLVGHTVNVGSYPLFKHAPYDLNLINKIVDVVMEHELELIHSHYAIPHAYAAWTAAEVLAHVHGRRVPLACTLHGTDISLVGKDPGFHHLTRFAIDKQQLLTAPSAWLARETAEHFGVDASRVSVIPNFVDLERFRPCAQPPCTGLAPSGYKVISHISNFRPVKRVTELVRAFAALRARLSAVLVLVGDGPDLPKAEAEARRLGVREDLRVLGRMDNVEMVLQRSDLFVLPSRSESFGLAALEALACGCPVLGYRTGGLPEVVEHGVSGLLGEEGCDACLGSMGADLLLDEQRHRAMCLAARDRAGQFATGPIIDRYEAGLSGLLAGVSASGG